MLSEEAKDSQYLPLAANFTQVTFIVKRKVRA